MLGFRSICWVDQKSRHFFWEQPSKYCVAEFTAIFVWCYQVDLDDIQWNEVATSTAHNFSNSWPLTLNFSNMINLCPNIWFIKNPKCQQFAFWKRSRQKTQIFHNFKGPLFRNGWTYWYEFWCILRDTPVDFLKSVVLQLFPKYSQSNVNLNVKSRAKFNCL